MGIADHSIVALRIFGDELVPSQVTALLGCEPTKAFCKGDVRVGKKTGHQYIEKTGRWQLSAGDRRPADIPAQIGEILAKLSPDLDVWRQLRSNYRMDFFCGMFMGLANDGLELSPELLGQLSERGIMLGLDIYDYSDERARAWEQSARQPTPGTQTADGFAVSELEIHAPAPSRGAEGSGGSIGVFGSAGGLDSRFSEP